MCDDPVVADDPIDSIVAIAGVRPCARCSADAFLHIHGRCADCVGDMGLRHGEEHTTWRTELAELVRSGAISGG